MFSVNRTPYRHTDCVRRYGVYLTTVLASFLCHASDENPLCDPYGDTGQLIRQFRLSAPLETIRLGTPFLSSGASDLAKAVAAFDIAFAYSELGDFNNALETVRLYLPKIEDSGHKPCTAHAYGAVGTIYYNVEDYEDALTWTEKALSLRQAQGIEDRVAGSLNNIGNIYLSLGQNALALEYYQLALKKWNEAGNELKSAMALSNLGHVDLVTGKYEDAFHKQKTAIPTFEKYQEHFSIAEAQHYQALALDGMGKLSEALSIAKSAQLITQKQHLETLSIQVELTLAKLLRRAGKIDDAITLVNDLLSRVSDQRQPKAKQNAYQFLAETYQSQERHQAALEAYQKYHMLGQQLFNRTTAVKIASVRINYELSEKERQIKLLQSEKSIAELELSRAKYLRTVWIMAAAVMLIIALFGTFLYTNRRELKRQQQLSERLEQLDKAKDYMLANTSHELRTPLNGIIGLSELIQHSESIAEAKSYSKMILDSGHRLIKVVDNLLSFARSKKESLKSHLIPNNLYDACQTALHLCKTQVKDKPISIENRIHPSGVMVLADSDQLQQILINLIGNAIKFTEKGQITLANEMFNGKIKVLVIDTGIGIPLDQHERIFEAFEQGDSTFSRRFEGLGLGLAICKRLVENQGGEIGLNSTVGEGSTFWFTLPTPST